MKLVYEGTESQISLLKHIIKKGSKHVVKNLLPKEVEQEEEIKY